MENLGPLWSGGGGQIYSVDRFHLTQSSVFLTIFDEVRTRSVGMMPLAYHKEPSIRFISKAEINVEAINERSHQSHKTFSLNGEVKLITPLQRSDYCCSVRL